MMFRRLLSLASVALTLSAGTAVAAETYPNSGFAGASDNIAIWGQAAVPTGYRDGGPGCSVTNEFCIVGLGAGAHARLYHPIADGTAFQLEVLSDFQQGLSNDDPTERAQFALYSAAGGHWIRRK